MKILSLILFCALPVGAQVINANSCSSSDVQTAFNAVVASTTTVNIPTCAGTAWTTQVSLTVPVGSTTLSILGAGSLSTIGGGDQTVIIDNLARGQDNAILEVSVGTGFFRMAGITFKTNGSSQVSYSGSVRIRGTGSSVRLDHDHWNLPIDGKQLGLFGCVYGVMDHSILDLTQGSTNNGVYFHQGNCGGDSSGYGNGQWNLPTALGSDNSFYFEQNVVNGGTNTAGSGSTVAPFVDDCSGGGRFVIRFNTINGATIQGHTTGHATDDRGCRAYEIYGNTFGNSSVTSVNDPVYSTFFNTSGTGVVWGNTFTGYYQYLVVSDIDRTNNGTYTQVATPSGWGYCSSSTIGGVPGPSNWDGNTTSQNGWPCIDQVGRGAGDLLSGNFPTKCDQTLGCSTYNGQWPNQALEPVYEWTDSWTSVSGWPGAVWNSEQVQGTNNRDYYVWCNASSHSGCTSFNGTAGVGSGTLASAPVTCTKGVGYWATDQGSWNQSGSGGQGVLYICGASNNWVSSYTPYTYPHPLVTGTVTPTAPTMLIATVVPK